MVPIIRDCHTVTSTICDKGRPFVGYGNDRHKKAPSVLGILGAGIVTGLLWVVTTSSDYTIKKPQKGRDQTGALTLQVRKE